MRNRRTAGPSIANAGAVVFDLSGTLVTWGTSYEACLAESMRDWLGRWDGGEDASALVDAALRRYREARKGGASRGDAVRGAIDALPLDGDERAARAIARAADALRLERATLAPGAEACLEALAGRYVLAVATNLDDVAAARLHARLGLGRFVQAERVFAGRARSGTGTGTNPTVKKPRKPQPAFFRAVASALGVPAARCLMVGDSLRADVQGALASGWAAVRLDKNARRPLARHRVDGRSFYVARTFDDMLSLLAPYGSGK